MKSHQLINQTSEKFEYFTPPAIIEAARQVMGWIDLDPASSEKANKIIKAGKIYTIEDDGLSHQWFGNIWLNHPFGRGLNDKWIKYLFNEAYRGRIYQFCCITYACTSEKWFQPLLQFYQCFLYPRTNYHLPDGTIKKGVTKGSVVTYYGPNIRKFKDIFSNFGTVK